MRFVELQLVLLLMMRHLNESWIVISSLDFGAQITACLKYGDCILKERSQARLPLSLKAPFTFTAPLDPSVHISR